MTSIGKRATCITKTKKRDNHGTLQKCSRLYRLRLHTNGFLNGLRKKKHEQTKTKYARVFMTNAKEMKSRLILNRWKKNKPVGAWLWIFQGEIDIDGNNFHCSMCHSQHKYPRFFDTSFTTLERLLYAYVSSIYLRCN